MSLSNNIKPDQSKMVRWCAGAIGRASDLRLIDRGFESCLGTIAQWPWASYLHLCASVTKQYNLVPAKAGE